MTPQHATSVVMPAMRRGGGWVLIVAWCTVVLAALGWQLHEIDHQRVALARLEAVSSHNKDLVYRRWASSLGGVYVRPTEKSPPNPHLNVPDRDIVTANGKELTLVNPAYMTRQVHQMDHGDYGVRGHITSLNPMRPENKPDEWETEALRAFDKGVPEVSAIVRLDGQDHLRYMRPMRVEPSCLKCHGAQGYSEGEIRGGISVSVPMTKYDQMARSAVLNYGVVYLFLGGLGAAIIWWVQRKVWRQFSARLRAAHLLRVSETKYRHLVSSAPVPILVYQDGKLTVVNDATLALLGARKAEELLGQPLLERVHPDSREMLQERERAVLAAGAPSPIWSAQLLRLDGTVLDAELALSTFVHLGEPALQLVVRDVTEQRRATAALEESRQLYEELVSSVPLGVYRLSLGPEQALRFEYVSDRVSEITGVSRVAALADAQAIFAIIHPEDREVFAQLHTDKIARQLPFRWEGRASIRGTTRWLHIEAQPALHPGRPPCWTGVIYDCTSRVEMEQQLRQAQKMEAVGQLTGGIAHDFNNILAAILIHLDLLLEDENVSPEAKTILAELVLEARRAANITRQLLMFSRRSVLEMKEVNLHELVTQSLRMLQRLLGENIQLEFDGNPGLPPVEADEGMIDQVLLNLSINARDAMPRGGKLTIRLAPEEISPARAAADPALRAGSFITLAVSDTGSGMAPETVARIFDPFFTTKPVGKGTGLGLATVHGIVAQHNGWITVDSALGRGTTFTIRFPVASAPNAATAAAQPEAQLRGRETILLVEDEVNIRRALVLGLERWGYRVLEAGSGPAALQLYGQPSTAVDLLISDMIMPGGMTGLELAQELRRIHPGLKVLISSGYSLDLVSSNRLAEDGITLLAKPYQLESLARSIRRCLAGR
ncbi:MAG: DUF3365 domain-containing protein [Opitutae bacterium]|nr:DUF3365 domain-containing protein [Opitutae bacterium]